MDDNLHFNTLIVSLYIHLPFQFYLHTAKDMDTLSAYICIHTHIDICTFLYIWVYA